MLAQHKTRNHTLDFIKGISIIFVLITHTAWSESERLKFGFPFWIDMAVPLFILTSGYAASISLDRASHTTIEKTYSKNYILKSVIRYILPFTVIFSAECTILLMRGCFTSFKTFLYTVFYQFFRGGWGPGSYYVPFMLQFIFVFPVIFFIIKRHSLKGLTLCFIVNLLYEILKTALYIGDETYRLLIFRYIFLIAFGSYLYLYRGIKFKMIYIIFFIAGTAFITATKYMNYQPIFLKLWTGTSVLASLYIIPLFAVLINKKRQIKFKPLEILGTASYNIFLVQMLYYQFYFNKIVPYIGNKYILLLCNILICITAGLALHYAEKPVFKLLSRLY